MFDANLYGSVNFVRELVPLMRAAARPAHIVTIASIVGMAADGRLGAYTAANRRDEFYVFTHASSEERLRNYQKALLSSF